MECRKPKTEHFQCQHLDLGSPKKSIYLIHEILFEIRQPQLQ